MVFAMCWRLIRRVCLSIYPRPVALLLILVSLILNQDPRLHRLINCSTVPAKDGNGYPLSACPRVKNPLDTGSGTSLYPRVWVRVAFDIRGYLQNGYEKVVSIPDTRIPADMWGHMLDNIYSLGFTEGTPPPLGCDYCKLKWIIAIVVNSGG